MNDLILSIVMPVYNVEPWLERAAKSALAQTETRLELILVDDASPDGCGALCDALAQADPRARVIHRAKNGGLSAARNDGLAAARGRYVCFMDSDDWIEPELLGGAVAALERTGAQWAVWGVTEEHFDANGKPVETHVIRPDAAECADAASMRRQIVPLEWRTLLGYAWNKLYRLDFLREHALSFRDVPLIEDILFNIDVARRAGSLVALPACGYHYARRAGGSLTARALPRYFELSARRVEALLALLDEWDMADGAALDCLAAIYGRYAISALERAHDRR
ncbi:MAG: glycosyltransferase family 2 protein, partial [Clostridia bacterium]|nr:glycosyltransferase family 2 protein [Clostridia bacterium]